MRTGQAAITANDNKRFDAVENQIAGRLATAVPLAKFLAASLADDRAPFLQNAADVIPADRPNLIAAIYHALVPFIDRVDFCALFQS